MEYHGKSIGTAYLSQSVNQISTPLQTLGITLIHFVRIYNNNQRISLCNDPILTEFIYDFYLNKYTAGDFGYLQKLNNNHVQVLDFTVEKNTIAHFAQQYNQLFFDAFLYQNKSSLFTDFMYFSGKNIDNTALYMNHYSLFKRFYYFFLDTAEAFIQAAQKNLVTPKNIHLMDQTNMQPLQSSFIQQTKIKRFFVSQDVYLSGRECEVLAWLGIGKTYDEIALILGLAKRTIINHFENIKLKANLVNLNELICFSIKNNFPELFIY